MLRTNDKNKRQRGYTLLEYCAGAAIIASILWGALSTLGGSLNGLLSEIGTWASKRTAEVQAADTNSGSSSSTN